MTKRACPATWRPVVDPSPTVDGDSAWRALHAAYQKWFECEREAKQKRFQRMTSEHRRLTPSTDEIAFGRFFNASDRIFFKPFEDRIQANVVAYAESWLILSIWCLALTCSAAGAMLMLTIPATSLGRPVPRRLRPLRRTPDVKVPRPPQVR